MNLENTKLITHKSCMDGSGCAIAFICAGGKYENIVFSEPDHKYTDENLYTLLNEGTFENKILVADVSVSKAAANYATEFYRVTLLDHHPSAADLKSFDWCTISSERCGSKLLYDWLYKKFPSERLLQCSQLISFIDDRDRWLNRHKESLVLEELHTAVGQEAFVKRFVQNPTVILSSNEKYLLEVLKTKQDAYIKDKKKDVKIVTRSMNGKDYRVAYVLSSQYTNVVAESIYSDPELNVDVVVLVGSKKLSLRSTNKSQFNVQELAMKFGGGGHKNSGGLFLENLFESGLIDLVDSHLFRS